MMKKTSQILMFMMVGLMAIAIPNRSFAQQILAFKFTYNDNGKQESSLSTSTNANLEQSVLSRGKGASNTKPASTSAMVAIMAISSTREEAIKNDAYYEFFIKTKPGYKVSLKTLKANMRIQEASANTYRWRVSTDNGKTFSDIGTEDVKITDLDNLGSEQPVIDLQAVKTLQNVKTDNPIIFRLYAWGGTSENIKNSAFGLGKTVGNFNNVISVAGYITPSN